MATTVKIKNLLVSEDDKVLIRFYQQGLKSICEHLVVVGTSQEAIELLTGGNFDTLITDLRLEKNDGLDVVNRAVKYNPSINILVASGYVTDAHYHDEMVKIPQIKGYLQKPFTIERLIEKLGEITGSGDNHSS